MSDFPSLSEAKESVQDLDAQQFNVPGKLSIPKVPAPANGSSSSGTAPRSRTPTAPAEDDERVFSPRVPLKESAAQFVVDDSPAKPAAAPEPFTLHPSFSSFSSKPAPLTPGNEMWQDACDTSQFLANNAMGVGDTVAMIRYKMCLVGDAEVGKTSLMKCFQSQPLFFKSLPSVDCTVGIQQTGLAYERDGYRMEVIMQDFAGQEVYHGHSAFLTNRCLFIFVWNMSGMDQSYGQFGISPREEERVKYWLNEVQSRSPGCLIAIVGTHKDQLRDQSPRSVEAILQKVHDTFTSHIDTMRTPDVPYVLSICSTFAVSCKDRTCVAENRGGPTTIKEMFRFLADVCFKSAARDIVFPALRMPAPVQYIVQALAYIRNKMNVMLMPIHEFQRLLWQLQVVNREQQDAMTRLLHDWNEIYVFDRRALKLSSEDFVFLHPRALNMLSAALFSYAHACLAPAHERSRLKALNVDIAKCDAADPRRVILKGFLIKLVAKEVFSKTLESIRRDVSDLNVGICLDMLQTMDLVRKIDLSQLVMSTKSEYAALPQPIYVVPSLLPPAVASLASDMHALFAPRGIVRVIRITPFPSELFFNLVSRLMFMSVALGPACHWSDAVWVGGGGGADGKGLGLGPLRGLVTWDRSEQSVVVQAIHTGSSGSVGMTLSSFVETILGVVMELLEKYRGVHSYVHVPCNKCHEQYDVSLIINSSKKDDNDTAGTDTTATTHNNNACESCSAVNSMCSGAERTKELKKAVQSWLWNTAPEHHETVALRDLPKNVREKLEELLGYNSTAATAKKSAAHALTVLGLEAQEKSPSSAPMTPEKAPANTLRASALLDDLLKSISKR